MSPLGRAVLRGHKQLRRDLGNPTFDWAGNRYVCVPNEAQSSRLFGLGGFALESDLVIFVEYALLPATNLPSAMKTLTYRGKKYRIDKAALEPGESVYKIMCTDPTKGQIKG